MPLQSFPLPSPFMPKSFPSNTLRLFFLLCRYARYAFYASRPSVETPDPFITSVRRRSPDLATHSLRHLHKMADGAVVLCSHANGVPSCSVGTDFLRDWQPCGHRPETASGWPVAPAGYNWGHGAKPTTRQPCSRGSVFAEVPIWSDGRRRLLFCNPARIVGVGLARCSVRESADLRRRGVACSRP